MSHSRARCLSRVDSLTWIASFVVFAIGLVIAGPVAAAIGVRNTLLGAAGLAALAVSAVLSVREVRELGRVEPATATDVAALVT